MQLQVIQEERLRSHQRAGGPADGASRALAGDLRDAIEGEVRFDAGSRALYATDASNYRQVPIGVVIPRHVEDVARTVAICARHSAPVLSRGGGTSLAGQCCNVAVVMDFTKYVNRPLHVDAARRIGTAQPGCVLDRFQAETKKHGLIFGPDPATHDHCAIGGMLGNNSCGIHSLMSWNQGLGMRTSDNVHELEVLTYRGERFRVGATPPKELERIIAAGGAKGEIYRRLKQLVDEYGDDIRSGFPKLPRRVSGYNLDDLLPENGFHVARALVGSEGTLVTILEAALHLVPNPKGRALLVLGYPDVFAAAEHVSRILEFKPIGLEGLDDVLVEFVRAKGAHVDAAELLPEGRGFLLAEFGAETEQEARDQARRCMEALQRADSPPNIKFYAEKKQEHLIWELREAGLGSTAFVPQLPDTWPGWEDSAVPVEKLAPYLRDLRALFDKFGYRVAAYGHFGQGIIHCRIPFDLYTKRGVEQYTQFLEEAADLCAVKYGGSLSGEHGDGQARALYLPKMFPPRVMEAFRQFKRIWDPDGRMNPGKVIDPDGPADHLRLGSDYHPPHPATYFRFPEDEGGFPRAVLRCVGVGKCRRESGGTMCPSYMVTKEEAHSTRGRARLLWELFNGELRHDGWRSEPVREALDLCLMCKGCKGDCPVNVDLATYKAEFLAHYYAGRLRPREAYAFGWIGIWARLASVAPTLVNFVTHAPGLRAIAKWAAGMTQRRDIPPFAPQTFQQWFSARGSRNATGAPVLLLADTFHNHFHPDVARDAVEVLEDAGFRVIVPMQHLCCGRPLYDYGFLGMARRWLEQVLDALRPHIRAGVPLVVLEPSCWSVFADELTNLLPDDPDAQRLRRNVFMLPEFLAKCSPDYDPPKLSGRRALLHRHCHHKSELKESTATADLLGRMGLECHEPESGCCGMAGSFGYTAGEKYDVAVACGERALLPAVREAERDTIVISDGFSCREAIAQGHTGRHALHSAQVLAMALRGGMQRVEPEHSVVACRRAEQRRANRQTGALIAGGAVAGAVLYALTRKARVR